MTQINIVVAYARDRIIGRQGAIPWRVRSDLIHLKTLTKDQVVILGRKTYDSMAGYYNKSGRPMPASQYIILTRDEKYHPSNAKIRTVKSFEDALELVQNHASVYVIGGMQVYSLALPYAHKLYATEIDADIEGDAFFPDIKNTGFREVSRHSYPMDELNEYDYSFVEFER